MKTIQILWTYLQRVAPGLLVGAVLLLFIRTNWRFRIPIYLGLFILLRDVLTPLGLWTFGNEGFFWLRLSNDPWFLSLFGLSSGLIVFLLYKLDVKNRVYLTWLRREGFVSLFVGVIGALIVVLPLFLVYYFGAPLAERGGFVDTGLLPFIFVFALFGNLFEEVLFRGYVLNYLAESMNIYRAGIISGVVFAFCHIFLAITVTDIGFPMIIFTLWEGIIAGLIGARYGIIPAALTHGGAIFLLASGLI